MGRRKIEIQPIPHERNRAVTFLKRKNGLFKKAYELGVLCSVDVAVIIFEERPGNHVKLYQYCSTNIQDMVQRHLRYDGEKDTRGPADFSANAAKQMDDTGDGEDDDGEDDDAESGMRAQKRRPDGRLKPPMSMPGPDMGYPRMTIPPQSPLSMGGLQPSSSLPISSDRDSLMHGGASSTGSLKRQRVDHHSRSSSDDLAGSAAASTAYFPGPSSNYRQPYHHPTHPGAHPGHPGHPQAPYGSYFPGPTQTSPPSSFIPLQPEYSRGTAPTPSRTGSGAGSASGPPSAGGAGASTPGAGGPGYPRQQQYDPSLYPAPPPSSAQQGLMRHPQQPPQHHPHNQHPNDHHAIFPVYSLDDSGHHHQRQFSLEWPVHNSATGAPSGPTGPPSTSGPNTSPSTAASALSTGQGGNGAGGGGGPSTGPPQIQSTPSGGRPSSSAGGGGPSGPGASTATGESSWLDFLSGTGNSGAAGGGGGQSGAAGATATAGSSAGPGSGAGSEAARNTLSWERGHDSVADMFSASAGAGASTADGRPPSGRSGGNKRTRGSTRDEESK